jgi:very-short-patch-repair endonuclease
MDFLLLPNRRLRVVIEVDGKQHYAEGDQASPQPYAKMAREDRGIRLAGYGVFRFGAWELSEGAGSAAVDEFFDMCSSTGCAPDR